MSSLQGRPDRAVSAFPSTPRESRTALCLFGAAFQGANDGQALAQRGMHVTVEDIDTEAIERMRANGPAAEYIVCDAYEYAAMNLGRRRWDVVSVDPFTNQMARCWAERLLFMGLARRMLVLGCRPDQEADFGKVQRRSYIAGWWVVAL